MRFVLFILILAALLASWVHSSDSTQPSPVLPTCFDPIVVWSGDEIFVSSLNEPICKNNGNVVPKGGEIEIALFGLFIRWLESPATTMFQLYQLRLVSGVVGTLESHLSLAHSAEPWPHLYENFRASSSDPLQLTEPIQVVEIQRCWDFGSTLITIQGAGGQRRSMLKAGRLTVYN